MYQLWQTNADLQGVYQRNGLRAMMAQLQTLSDELKAYSSTQAVAGMMTVSVPDWTPLIEFLNQRPPEPIDRVAIARKVREAVAGNDDAALAPLLVLMMQSEFMLTFVQPIELPEPEQEP